MVWIKICLARRTATWHLGDSKQVIKMHKNHLFACWLTTCEDVSTVPACYNLEEESGSSLKGSLALGINVALNRVYYSISVMVAMCVCLELFIPPTTWGRLFAGIKETLSETRYLSRPSHAWHWGVTPWEDWSRGREFRGLRVAKDHAFEPLGHDTAICYGLHSYREKDTKVNKLSRNPLIF